MVLGGVSLHPCNLFHRLKYPHQSINGAMDHSNDSPQGRSWASLEQQREASRCFSYEVQFNLRVPPSKRDDYTLTRQTSQQKEAQEWLRSTFWLRLITRRKLLAALLPSVASHTQEKSWWTCVNAPRPHDERVILVLSHPLITYDLLLSHDCQIYSKIGEPMCFGTLTALRALLQEFAG